MAISKTPWKVSCGGWLVHSEESKEFTAHAKGKNQETIKANAAYIVKCVNNHTALVEFVQDFEDGENSLKHNSAQSVSDKWAEQTSGTAGWSDKAVMAFAYKDLREKHQQLLSKLGEE